MNNPIVILCAIILIYFVIATFLKNKKKHRRKYSLGLQSAEKIENWIKNKNYGQIENYILKQELNDITQIVDHLALSLNEEGITTWYTSENTDFSKLTLGVFYLHLAWIARSHKLAKDVSKKNAESFFEYLIEAKEIFSEIPENSFFTPELNTREIRLYMSLSNSHSATNAFHKVSKSNPELIWPYLHYTEFIQPKWGGDVEDLLSFYENLPDHFLIRSIVELKFIMDSIIMDDNYFKKYNANIYNFAHDKVIAIDKEFDSTNVTSIHKYILFNYMEAVCEQLNLNKLQKKYKRLMDNNYTIFPYGLIQ